MRFRSIVLVVASSLLVAAAAHSQGFDVTGTWSLEAAVTLPGEPGGECLYSGQTILSKDNGVLSGFAELSLISGDPDCPAEMSADLEAEGSFDGQEFFLSGQLLGGNLGEADFSGKLSPNPGGVGTFLVTAGPFANASGEWTAEQRLVSLLPRLMPVGLTLLLLLFLASGGFFLRQRPEEG